MEAKINKTVFLTGVAGFIGSHTAERLLSKGYRVVGVDNFNDYYSPERKRQNIEDILQHSAAANLKVVEADIRDRGAMEKVLTSERPQAIAHLAAMAGVRASMDNPALYYDVNLNGTLCLLDLAREKEISQFVFASTSSVYGKTPQIPFVENDSADQPLAPYPASKRAAELLGHAYHHLYKINFTALRFFTVYGPRGRPDMMAYKVLDNIFKGDKVPLYNNGQMHRDWTYVDDIVSGIINAIEKPLAYEVVNLGRGEPVLLADFVHEIEALAGKKSALSNEPMMHADIAYTFADISKAQKLLAYSPKVSVKQGVTELWRWYQERAML